MLPGALYQLPTDKSGMLTLSNSLQEDTINFLIIELSCGFQLPSSATTAAINIAAKNCLTQGDSFAANMQVGVYDSRVKDSYNLKFHNSNILAFVINGSFELEERLMEHRDTLLLWETNNIDFEALSETSILLLIECPTI